MESIKSITLGCLTPHSFDLHEDEPITAVNMYMVATSLKDWEHVVTDIFCCRDHPRCLRNVGYMFSNAARDVNHALIQVARGGDDVAVCVNRQCTAKALAEFIHTLNHECDGVHERSASALSGLMVELLDEEEAEERTDKKGKPEAEQEDEAETDAPDKILSIEEVQTQLDAQPFALAAVLTRVYELDERTVALEVDAGIEPPDNNGSSNWGVPEHEKAAEVPV